MATQAKTKWIEFWQRLGVKNNPAPYFAELEAHYSDAHRAYHNLAHVIDCLEEFEPAKGLAHDPLAVEMALWYHDAVYDPRAKDNEERSAKLATKVGGEIGLPNSLNQQVNNLILATKKHDASLDRDAAVMVDVDLSILGRESQRFDEYENQVRQEYSWVSDEAFAAGRTAVLEFFLGRQAIYSTDFFRNRYENQARENLNRSLHKLNPTVQK
jgi:predicted metal-dependent HD superfamily phosphohydrolase